jgi:hypothetical protein
MPDIRDFDEEHAVAGEGRGTFPREEICTATTASTKRTISTLHPTEHYPRGRNGAAPGCCADAHICPTHDWRARREGDIGATSGSTKQGQSRRPVPRRSRLPLSRTPWATERRVGADHGGHGATHTPEGPTASPRLLSRECASAGAGRGVLGFAADGP